MCRFLVLKEETLFNGSSSEAQVKRKKEFCRLLSLDIPFDSVQNYVLSPSREYIHFMYSFSAYFVFLFDRRRREERRGKERKGEGRRGKERKEEKKRT